MIFSSSKTTAFFIGVMPLYDINELSIENPCIHNQRLQTKRLVIFYYLVAF